MTAPQRIVCLDTETTGVSRTEDRIIEVGCVELVGGQPTGRVLHRYCNPAPRRVNPGAFAVHGLSNAFLADKPPFDAIVDELLAFIRGAQLVIHNAPFDVGMLNAEFARLYDPPAPLVVDDVVDTMRDARKRLAGKDGKGKSWSLDALAAHFKISTAARSRHHGALVDAEILAAVYRALNPPEQRGLDLFAAPAAADVEAEAPTVRPVFRSRLTDAERERHAAFVAGLGPSAVWNDYIGGDDAQG